MAMQTIYIYIMYIYICFSFFKGAIAFEPRGHTHRRMRSDDLLAKALDF